MSQNASTVGCIDLQFFNEKKDDGGTFFKKIKNNNFELIYLLGSDNFELVKKNEFIIYQGSHGDRGAEIADIILPSPAYTEQDGMYINLEGRLQECRKASYPAGQAKEDWKIFNLIIKKLKNEKLFHNYEDLKKLTLGQIKNFSGIDSLPNKIFKNNKKLNSEFFNEKILINEIDYYFTNSIARASKTMSDCRNVKIKSLKEGTNN